MSSTYQHYRRFWDFVDDIYKGNAEVKSPQKAEYYLPKHPSEFDEPGLYDLRLHLTHFENAFRPLIDEVVGIMQKNPAKVRFGAADDEESPQEVRDLDVYGNLHNDGLTGLKWRVNFAQALFGRIGLLLDLDGSLDEKKPRFRILEYPASTILDGENRNWYLLDESTEVFDPVKKEWKDETRWRVLGLDAAGKYFTVPLIGDKSEVEKKWKDFDLYHPPTYLEYENPDDPANPILISTYPNFHGVELDFIPFTVCNAKKLGIDEWQMPPYFDAAQSVVDAYNADSFYRRAVTNHATPTLVGKNVTPMKDDKGKPLPLRVGGMIWVEGDGMESANVSILQASSDGLNALKASKDDILEGFKRISIKDLLDGAGANSSGEAIMLRMLSGTASIVEIDLAGEKAIEEQLCFAARWAGATWEEVGERISYEVDTSYAKTDFSLTEVTGLLSANLTLDLLSKQALYEILRQKIPALPTWDDNEAQKQELKEIL